MENNYYIRGTKSGAQVIKTLEDKGGINKHNHSGNHPNCIYFIRPNGLIDYTIINDKSSEEIAASLYEIITHTYKEIFPRNIDGTYYTVKIAKGIAIIKECTDTNSDFDTSRYESQNYFIDRNTCQKAAERINKIISLSHYE